MPRNLIFLVLLGVLTNFCLSQDFPFPPPSMPGSNPSKPRWDFPEVPMGPIEFGEISAYLQALNRFYARRCSRRGNRCDEKLAYAAQWFQQAAQLVTTGCQ